MEQARTGRPAAIAHISGEGRMSGISGVVSFYNVPNGTRVVAEIEGLPAGNTPDESRIFGFHIHEGLSCTGADFSDTGGHYNPYQSPHPNHVGDLPPLFEAGGRAYLSFITGRFRIPEIIGRTVVIHSDPDDFRSQPGGDAGRKIACGFIRRS